LLSKLKEALYKLFEGAKEIYKKAFTRVAELNLKGRIKDVLTHIKNVDIKGKFTNIINKVREFDIKKVIERIKASYNNTKKRVSELIGSEGLYSFLKNLDIVKLDKMAAGVFLVLVICAWAGSGLDFGYGINCDGKTVAITAKRSDAVDAYEEARIALDALKVTDIGDVKIIPVISPKDNFLTASCAKNAIAAVYDGRQDAYGISAEGVIVTAVKTEEEAEKLFEDYKKEFTSETTLEVGFNKNVEIVSARVPKNSVLPFEDAYVALKTPVGGIKTHTVKEGETISEIAELTGTTTQKVLDMNPGLTPERLQIGQKLNVSDTTPAIAVKTKEAVTAVEKIAYDTNKIKDATQYTGITIVVSDGEYGEKEVSYDVYKENGIITERIATAEEVLKEPVTKQVKVGTKKRPVYMATGKFRNPFAAGSITSRYGNRSRGFHTGLDLAGASGSPVYAADGGTVSFAGWSGGYGKLIKINHGNGYVTYYAHLSSINVSNGKKVAKGEMIGRVGNTGNSTGPHLHFEIRLNGKTLNPANYIY